MADHLQKNESFSKYNTAPILAMDPPQKPKWNKFAFACAILASMTSILLGYDIGVMSGAGPSVQNDLKLTDVQLEVVMGILNLYSLIGSAAAGRTSDRFGRRYTLILASVFFFIGAIVMGLAPNYPVLMIGRFVAGLGVGYALMIAPVYTTEVAPTSSRGFLTTFPEVFINAGILVGFVSNFAFSKLPLHIGWRLMLGVGAIPAVCLAIGVLAMPESPRWLVLQGRLGEAKRVLEKTSDSEEEVLFRLADIKKAAGIPEEYTEDFVQVPKNSQGEGVWKELFLHPTATVRHILLAGIGIHFFQQSSGIDSVVLYSPKIFGKAGITSKNMVLLCTVAVGFVKTLTILVGTFLVDRAGRRPLLLTNIGGMTVCLATLGMSLTIIDRSSSRVPWAVGLAITSVLAFVSAFSIGMGPVTWVYNSEIFPLRLRAQGTSMGVAINRTISGTIGMTFLSLSKALTIGGAFFFYMTIAAIGWVYFYTLLPETQGRSLEDMQVLFGTFFWWRSTLKELEKDKTGNNNDGDQGNNKNNLGPTTG